jgi:mono/diheme cytochrome c family protein
VIRSRREFRSVRKPTWRFVIALAAGFGCSATAPAEEGPPMSPGWRFAEQGGVAIYVNVCAACHQPDAKGAEGAGAYPALARNPELASGDYVLRVVLNGLRGMPPVGGMMTDQQVADVINYVRTHFGNDYHDLVPAAAVKAARPQGASEQ